MNRLSIILALLLVTAVEIHCVAQRLDSLHEVLSRAATDRERVDALNLLSAMYAESEPDSAIALGGKAYALAERFGYEKGQAEALNVIGSGHLQKQEYAIARSFLDRSLLIWEALDNKEQRSQLHGLLAAVAEQQGDFPEALKHHLARLRFEELAGDRQTIADLTSNIGNVYDMMGQHDEAVARHLEAIRLYELLGDSLGIARASNNLGTAYDSKGAYEEGLFHLTRALDIAEKMGNPMGIAICLGSIANHHHRVDNKEEALTYYLKTLPLFEQMENVYNLAATHINIGQILIKLQRYPEAQEYLERGLALAMEIGARQWIANAHSSLTDLYSMRGDDGKALFHYRQYNAYQDSITNEENVRRSVQVQMQYDFDKKETLARAEQERKDQRQRLVRNGIAGVLALSILFLAVVWRQRNSISKEKRRSEELLLNILPEQVAEELKSKGEAEAKLINEATVLFTDFKGFTSLSEKLSPKELVKELHECFSAFDAIMARYGIEKIKTIGDAYMAAGGLPTAKTTHALDVVHAAFDIRDFIDEGKKHKQEKGLPYFEIRIGIHSGPVVAGIVGVKKFSYDIWGDTVNTASRMESSGEAGQVNISEVTYALVKDEINCEYRGEIEAKGKGKLGMYFAKSRKGT